MSDEELELICQPKKRKKLIFPFVHWESEIYSLGKTLRAWAIYPSFLKLFFMADHGIYPDSKIYPNELENRTKFHFTWKSEKARRINSETKFSGLHLTHPWIFYKNKFFPDKNQVKKGTIIFLPKSDSNNIVDFSDLESYFLALQSLESKYQPYVVCLSASAVNAGLHKELRKYSLPLITLGRVEDKDFVDRFYSTVFQFSHATSRTVGSQTYFIIEAGIPYFLFGDKVRVNTRPQSEHLFLPVATSLADVSQKKYSKFESDLYIRNDAVTEEQNEVVSLFLGKDSKVTRFRGVLLIWGTLLRFDIILKFYLTEIKTSFIYRFNKKRHLGRY